MEQTSVANLETKDSLDDSDYLVVDDLTTTKKILARQLLADCLYPVGSIYMSVNSTSPAELFGGTWEQIKDTFLLGSGSYTLGATGGEKTHTLSESELPAISGSMNFTNEENGSNVWKIYGHITGTKIEKNINTATQLQVVHFHILRLVFLLANRKLITICHLI